MQIPTKESGTISLKFESTFPFTFQLSISCPDRTIMVRNRRENSYSCLSSAVQSAILEWWGPIKRPLTPPGTATSTANYDQWLSHSTCCRSIVCRLCHPSSSESPTVKTFPSHGYYSIEIHVHCGSPSSQVVGTRSCAFLVGVEANWKRWLVRAVDTLIVIQSARGVNESTRVRSFGQLRGNKCRSHIFRGNVTYGPLSREPTNRPALKIKS